MVVKRSPVQHVARPEPPESLAALVAANERLQRFAAELAGEQQRAQVERSWLRTMIDQVPDYLYIKDKDARFVIANRAVAADLGHGDPNTLIGKSDLDVHPPQLARRYYEDDMSVIRGEKALIDHEEYVVRPDGTQLWLSTSKLPLRNPEGQIIGLVCSARDITERRRTEAHIHFLAYHDSLTGLPNRAQFERDLAALAGRAAEGVPATLVLIDLDRFKHINDTLGHVAGDDLLRQLANRLFQLVGPAGTLARVGGDEFAILLSGPAAGAAESLCRAIQLQFGRPFRLFDDPAFITASFGIAPWRPGSDALSMLREADIALYEAKARGRGRWEVFTPPMAETVEEKRRIEQDLRRALDTGGELTLEYQPIFAADGRTVAGAEALVRWEHPERGRLAPDVFIGVAEERGLIEKLGEWVLEEACRMLARTTIPWVAVNVSPVELKSRRFVDRVIEQLRLLGISPARLQLEITEGVLLDTSEATESGLTRLRAAGIRLALDDFGTGYSSLNYLRRYNVDKLKIDRSFVGQLGQSTDAEVIVRTIIDLARSLNMKVTAEGVATEQQRDYLMARGCHELQGYLLSKPLPLEAFLEFTGIAA
ncbi:bifunctional diguanylate cyclase/phosphodiesterase [Devosia sp. Root413D1]|uniref:putative bifunctional diguanylate cyclase/phosphodiesterase n=1 Tax=Devosia sp. Root413D1 TaxID=1736531 RepID=UPI0009E846D9|nr:EAL domain-containing protein [Devosia sp. Root413D1]